MDSKNFFFRQKVSESEMDAAFSDAEDSLWANRLDDNIVGVITGLVPSLGASPTVDITKGVAITSLGKRVVGYTDGAPTKNFSYSTDTLGAATAVTGGNERWISVFAAYGRQALDLRTDGNGDPVYFDTPECLHDGTTSALGGAGVNKFLIVSGVMAGTGLATRPALVTGAVLVCDILRTPADGANVLSTSRRQVYGVADTAAPGTGNGLSLIMSALSTWLGGRTNPAQASLHATIDKIITDLAATTASDDGAERIGAQANGTLSAGSVRSQLDQLDTLKAALAAATNHFTGNQITDGNLTVSTDLAVTGNETVGGTLGVTGVATHSARIRITPTATVPAIDTPTVAEDVRMLLFESNFTRSAVSDSKIRIYLNNKTLATGTATRSLLITTGAAWDGTNWVKDAGAEAGGANRAVQAIEMGGTKIPGAPLVNLGGSLTLYRTNAGASTTFADSEWTNSSHAQVLDMAQAFSTANAAIIPVPFNDGGLGGGVNNFNPLNGEFRISVTGSAAKQRIHFGLRGVAAAGSEVHGGTINFPSSYTTLPTNITATVVGSLTNCGTLSVTAVDNRHATWSVTTTGAGAFIADAYIDVYP